MAGIKQFEPEQALERIMRVFWDKGFEAASYNDLVAVSGLNRSSLYNAFGDKRALFLAALRAYLHRVDHDLFDPTDREPDPSRRLHVFFALALEQASSPEGRYGCMLINAAIESQLHDADVQALLSERLNAIGMRMRRWAEEASALGRNPCLPAPEHLTQLLIGGLLGLRVLARAGADELALQRYTESYIALIDGRPQASWNE